LGESRWSPCRQQGGSRQSGKNFLFHSVSLGYFETRVRGGFLGLNGQSMQALVDEILQGIIHKAMPCDPAFASKSVRNHTNTKMGSETGSIGAGMARVLVTFVKHFETAGRKSLAQALFELRCVGAGVHGAAWSLEASAPLMCGAM
jgi:hypothetical protein